MTKSSSPLAALLFLRPILPVYGVGGASEGVRTMELRSDTSSISLCPAQCIMQLTLPLIKQCPRPAGWWRPEMQAQSAGALPPSLQCLRAAFPPALAGAWPTAAAGCTSASLRVCSPPLPANVGSRWPASAAGAARSDAVAGAAHVAAVTVTTTVAPTAPAGTSPSCATVSTPTPHATRSWRGATRP